jgi:CBS-domain-containing membrane protein
MAALKKVAPEARATTLIREVICPLDMVSTASPTDPVVNLLGVSDGCSEGRTLVINNGRLVGIISPSDLNRLLKGSLSGRFQAPSSLASM